MRFKAYTVAFHLRISAIPLLVAATVRGKKHAAPAGKRCDKRGLPELVKSIKSKLRRN